VVWVLPGNFSFTLSLLTSYPSLSPSTQILATSYDTREVCFLKYPDAEEIVGKIEAMGVQVLWEVDAGDLEANEVIRVRGKKGGFNRVVFNFPHAGSSTHSAPLTFLRLGS
jgi:25S rRNA (uracil2634-N3)-methyltransferase